MWPAGLKDYNNDFESPFIGQSDGTVSFTGVVKCGSGGKEIARSTPPAFLTVGAGSGTYTCNSNNQCIADPKGIYPDSTCNYKCIAATQDKSYKFEIKNPLQGGPQNIFDLINIATRLLLQISIPLAVL